MTLFTITISLWTANIRGQLRYRADFLIMVVMSLIFQATGFAFIWVILSRFQDLATWTLNEVAFLYGLRLVIRALSILFSGQIRILDMQIRQADFDRYLVRPLPPLLQIMSQGGQVNAFGDLLGGFGILVTVAMKVTVDWTPMALVYLGLAIIGGTLIEVALELMIAAFGFRLLNTRPLLSLLDSFFSSFGNYPLTIFSSTVQFLLIFGLPLAFMAYFPATVLLGRTHELSVPPFLAYAAPLAGVIWFLLALCFFDHELRNYQSSGH